MRITKYHLARDYESDWDFSEVSFSRINLLVGASGTGKTRFLNTMINFLKQLTADKLQFTGDWDVEFVVDGIDYEYKLTVKNMENNPSEKYVNSESLLDKTNDVLIVKRMGDSTIWNGNELPKLNKQVSCFVLFKDNDELSHIFRRLSLFAARRFNGDELAKAFGNFGPLHPNVIEEIRKTKDLYLLVKHEMDFHNKLNLLKDIDSSSYQNVCKLIQQAFPFIVDMQIAPLSKVMPGLPVPMDSPIFCIKEDGMKHFIGVNDISSGMQKMFLLILDTVLMRDEGILFIDEYENSLGINAINFLPDLIDEIGEDCQFIMTSHHPYIVNTVNIESWRIFHRKGMDVEIIDGSKFKEQFGKSRQEYFVQLINSDFYKHGIE